jgi:sugar lactone lactonase YvrE
MTEVLLTGLKIGESARWHDGRLWLSNWGAQQILAVDLDGNAQVMATVTTTIPFSIDWLPDGRLLVVAGPEGRLLRQEPDGSLVDHADLSGLGAGLNEIVVAGSTSTAARTSTQTRARRPGSSRWSRRMARSGGSRKGSRSPTGWRSPRTTRR